MVENSFVKKNPLQDLLSSLTFLISTNERNGILTDHVIFKLRDNEIYQMKTTMGHVGRKNMHCSLNFYLEQQKSR